MWQGTSGNTHRFRRGMRKDCTKKNRSVQAVPSFTWGNLLQKNMTQNTGETLTMLVNNKNWVTTPTFSYDADGDVTSDGTLTMTYDAEGRMITAVGGSVNDTYTYDGDGRRVKKS